MNKTFEDLQILQELKEAWEEVGPRIRNYMETSVEIRLLQVRLNTVYLCSRKILSPVFPLLHVWVRIC